MRIGARTLKSGIAIFISLLLPNLLGIPDATVLSGISSVAAMQQSVKRSYDTFSNRILSNVLGGILALTASYFFGSSYFVIAFSAIVLIAVLHMFNLDEAISLSCITLIVIMLNDSEALFTSALIRVIGTIIGVTVSFLVNQFVLPPKYDEALYKKIVLQTDEIAKLLRAALRKNSQHGKVREDIKALDTNESKMDTYFQYISDEARFGNKTLEKFKHQNDNTDLGKARTLVVYRQFLRSNKAGVKLIKAFHNYEYLYNSFPKALRVLIRERLETLITAHEQVILKFNGRINAEAVNFHEYKQEFRRKLLNSFFSLANSDEYMQDNQYEESNGIIHLMSRIFQYEEEVQHLNVLVRSYRTFHQETIEEIGEEVNLD